MVLMNLQLKPQSLPTALVTGASKGLGRALAEGLAARGWRLVIDARGVDDLHTAAAALAERTTVEAVAGDIADPDHRAALTAAVGRAGRLDVLINNASSLGPSPLPALVDVDEATFLQVYRVNVIAPLLLFAQVRHLLDHSGATIINITSDAAGGPWPGWGLYGSSKAALDQVTNVLAVEHPDLGVYAVDPGDLRTAMHQTAFPGDDISDRPEPSTVVPAILSLLERRPPSGRYHAAEFLGGVTP